MARAATSMKTNEAGETLYGIADLAAHFDISQRTIRFYEDKGLISPQRVGTQRIYTETDRQRLSLILRAKVIGSTLSEIRTFLQLYGQEGEGREKQLRYVIERTGEKIAELEDKRRQIDETLDELRLIHEGSKERLRKLKG
ncbi:MerR family transcriptional regulator [Glycocaulis alkaliphilus]|uniref:MerR family transcriptional regulator n=2 Tax=Glycocaulis alkaliphilus TaxID=1434191 RepID=A0A3T0E710_9PROT|nr:MerR family transcriptional regulator [Glycocaulis alkaliphilus]GGB71469.1 MerR family transcriptional regulator [Glycocaulis alkaliphilus]